MQKFLLNDKDPIKLKAETIILYDHMPKLDFNYVITAIALILIAKIFLVASKDPSQWTGFFVTTFHIVFIALGSMYVLKNK